MNGNEGDEAKGAACDDLRGRRTTLEKRGRESSGVSSSTGECTSGESRAAHEDGQGNEAGSKENHPSMRTTKDPSSRQGGENGGDKPGQAFGGGTGSNGGKPKLPRPSGIVECPRCHSMDTKFCYYNNYNIKQPRYFCKSCQRYWTSGGTLRNVPVGAGRRKHKSSAKSEKNRGDAEGLVVNGSQGQQFSPFHDKNSMALTYAAVAALKPQSLVAPAATEMLDGKGGASPVAQDGAANRPRSRSRSKKKQFVLANHLDSKGLGAGGDPNGDNASNASAIQDQGQTLQAMMQWQAMMQAYGVPPAPSSGVQRPVPNFTSQAYQQLLSQNWAQVWQQAILQQQQQQQQQTVWNSNPAVQTLLGMKREGWQPVSGDGPAGGAATGQQAGGGAGQQAADGDGANLGGADQQASQQQATATAMGGVEAQIPWWYTQMVNNFAATQNPSAMMRSYNLQAQMQTDNHPQENHQE
ncbi:Dof-type domain-containing protein [Chloropicon primus]|uniref:Dof-type domain-containing protein n=1 Tax=Chloropicon primus TaxID=1764295 RepID=A0A5B8MHB0_9CHLO|nr:hypothetical protein A3770_03p23410 [Chloropicon primus]UPQ99033.1 Dof-type domain-containing protein [Chloropicon primus]|eukprot:QDZ19823.1 hypothetical protein A3770_03p23410 [Chloropicon primus]